MGVNIQYNKSGKVCLATLAMREVGLHVPTIKYLLGFSGKYCFA